MKIEEIEYHLRELSPYDAWEHTNTPSKLETIREILENILEHLRKEEYEKLNS